MSEEVQLNPIDPDTDIEMTPELEAYIKGIKPGVFVTVKVEMEPDGNITAGIVKVPIDLRIIEDFQAQAAAELEKENIKLVIHNGEAFCAPVKTTNLILPKSGLIM